MSFVIEAAELSESSLISAKRQKRWGTSMLMETAAFFRSDIGLEPQVMLGTDLTIELGGKCSPGKGSFSPSL